MPCSMGFCYLQPFNYLCRFPIEEIFKPTEPPAAFPRSIYLKVMKATRFGTITVQSLSDHSSKLSDSWLVLLFWLIDRSAIRSSSVWSWPSLSIVVVVRALQEGSMISKVWKWLTWFRMPHRYGEPQVRKPALFWGYGSARYFPWNDAWWETDW